MIYYFFKRELKEKYLGNITGFAWVFIQPLITLLIYWFVFDKIFKQRIIGSGDAQIEFIVYLAVGFWPWVAFSESVVRAITSVSDKIDLIGKVKLDCKMLVIASVSATFLLHLIGYSFVLLILILVSDSIRITVLPLILFPICQLYFLAIALGLIFSAIQIFIKDTLQFITTLMTLWFFLTPIIYSESILPDKYKALIQLNPLYIPISFIHNALITGYDLPWLKMLAMLIITFGLVFISVRMFNKLAPHFEDYK